MLKINYCDLYRYSKTSFKNKDKEHIKTKHLFIYLKDIKKLNSLNFNFDLNLKRLIYYLKNKRIDFIFIFYDDKIVIHSSGVCLKKESIDKFFYHFEKKKYAVIGPTFTNENYRGRQFYQKALNLQIKNLIYKHQIDHIFISTERQTKDPLPFHKNNLIKFCSGIIVSVFSKIFIYIVYNKNFKLRAFLNDTLILKFM